MSRRAPRPLALALAQLDGRLAPATTLARVQAVWTRAAGDAVAAAASPVAERAGVLTLRCESAVWAHELELMEQALLPRLNDALGEAALSGLRCRVG